MAWRVPRFGIRHSMRDRGYSNVWVYHGAGSSGYQSFIYDERREVFTHNGTETDHFVQVYLGTDYANLTVDRLVIPFGHNYNTRDLRVREDDNDAMSSATTLYGPTGVSGTGQIDVTITESSEAYIRVDWNGASFQPETPEMWLTKTLAPTTGASPDWMDYRVYNVLTSVTPAGDRGDLQLGASQRVFELEYPKVYVAADIAILDQLVDDVGMEKAFLFDPPFDDEATLICKMLRPPERRFAYPAPASGTKGYTYRFSIIEQLV